MILKTLVDNLESFPEVEIKSRALVALKKLYPEVNENKYMGACIILAFAFAFFVLVLSVLMGLEFEPAILAAFSALLLVYAFFLALPAFELNKKTKIIEAEMPFTLRTIGMLRNMNITFIKCLSMAAEEESEISRELKGIVNDVGSGITLERSFSKFAALFSSYPIKRAITQIISAYELGSSGTEMRRIGDELLAVQQHQMREYASKSAIFGMLFIMTSAILPVFFLVYVLIGNFGVGGGLEKGAIALILLLIFPAISVLLLIVSKASVPYSPLIPKSNILDANILIPAIVFLASFLVEDELLRLGGLIIGGAAMLYFVYTNYQKEKRNEEIEHYLPDALFSVSALPKSTKVEKIFETIERGGYGALSDEASKAKRQLSMNIKVDSVLDDLWRRNESPALKKVCIMMKHAHNTNSLDQLHFIAEDLLKNFEIKRERANLMSMQKYTVLFGGFIIPFILKIAISLITSLIDFMANSPVASEMIQYVVSLIPAYLVMYALISSFYVADIEGRKSRAAIYFLLLAIVSITIFNAVSF
ncbi:MAG: type II secretion system F family protein [Candidatus Bilamarchaeaceae archaeon]